MQSFHKIMKDDCHMHYCTQLDQLLNNQYVSRVLECLRLSCFAKEGWGGGGDVQAGVTVTGKVKNI